MERETQLSLRISWTCVYVYIYTHTHQILDGEGNPVVLAHLVQMFLQLRNTNIFCVNE